ncbi:DUF6491 family protein [uncultured Alteromonas sp.]|jgi:hypothetical protein|uniref:DUF6491 family protein n=1 Tax=uncultured Alteromonas sp. TaxID=179113 RepID=UPI0025CEEC20|nr:DUF6491 family protein [uncultured Alteromonas sp.]
MKRYWILAMTALVLAGCATPRLTNSEMVTLVEQFVADESLERDHTISAFRLDSYTELSDEYLILRSSPRRHYLVKLVPRCNEIAFAPGILLHRRFGNSLSEGTDFIYTPDSLPFKCYINKIYPLSREQHDQLREQIKAEVKELELKEQQLEGEDAADSQ